MTISPMDQDIQQILKYFLLQTSDGIISSDVLFKFNFFDQLANYPTDKLKEKQRIYL